MKKIMFFPMLVLALLVAIPVTGQGNQESGDGEPLLSKRGHHILPQAGDFALGIDAGPILTFAGELVQINSGGPFVDPSSFDYAGPGQAIYGKYFVREDFAYRFRVRIGYNSNTMRNRVTDDSYDGDVADYIPAEDDVVDKRVQSFTNIRLSGGAEWRRGYGRLQGFYGGEGLFIIQNGTVFNPNERYVYGNEHNEDNPAATTTTDFGTGASSLEAQRIISVNQGLGFGLGLRAFVGVEYFFAPKMSIGGEFGWGPTFMGQTNTVETTEAWDAVENELVEAETVEANPRNFNLDTDNNFGGMLFLLFHF